MSRWLSHRVLVCLIAFVVLAPHAWAQEAATAVKKKPKKPRENPVERANSLRAIARHLGVGEGASIADIGAGNGRDSWTFAGIVGDSGTVFSEEIVESKVKGIKEAAEKRGLSQIKPVLGGGTDPGLQEDSVDMAFMHFVYHHMSQPREMLSRIWKALKPGGYYVVVDKRRGTLVDWVPRERRATKHFWIAETTVVREAREAGFRYVECAEQLWHAKDTFVLVFQRPEMGNSPMGDPDAAKVLPHGFAQRLLPFAGEHPRRVAFVALGPGRSLIAPLLKALSADAVDIVLEEWATQKEERPALPEGINLPSVLTENGNPGLSDEPIDTVFFLDSYHLLFHGPALLEHLHKVLADEGTVCILDRIAPHELPHREASHRRMIARETVKREMQKAGFVFANEESFPSVDRFLLVFKKG